MTQKQARKIAKALAANMLDSFEIQRIEGLTDEEHQMLKLECDILSSELSSIRDAIADNIVNHVLKRKKVKEVEGRY